MGSALTTTGTAAGFFAGVVDEVRIWNNAWSLGQIQATKDVEITSAQSGLLGAWNFNEGSGTALADSSGNGINGVSVGSPTWVPGFVPPAPGNVAPNAPTLNAPGDAATGVDTSPTLDVGVSDPNAADSLTVTYFGRPYASGNFVQIAQHAGIASGANDTVPWPNLGAGQTFEWYATVNDGNLTATGPTWTFHTVASADPVFVGAGDIGSCDVTTDTDTGNILQGIDGNVFTTGDNVYDFGTAADFANCYAPTPWGASSIKDRTRPIPGNHDWGTGGPETLADYFSYFGANATDANGKSYYSYDIPSSNWHVVNLDSECQLVPGGCSAGSAQELWLRADLAANSTKNVIAIWHKPRYSSGATNYQALQPLWDDLYEFGVDILLDGHDHIYERFSPMKSGATPSDPPVADSTYGIRQFTVGTGGEAHHGLATTLPTSQVRNDTTFGIFKLTLHADSYDWTFLPIAGSTFTDSGTGTVHDAPPTSAIEAPSVDAVALAGNEAFVVGRSPANELWYRETSSGSFGDWAEITDHGVASAPSAVRNGSDLYVFFRATNNELHYFKRSGDTWGPEQNLGGVIAGAPSAAVDGDGDVIVGALNAAGNVFANRLSGGSWIGWTTLDGVLTGRLKVVSDGTDVDLLGVNDAGSYWYRHWTTATDAWGPWTPLDGVLTSSPDAVTVDGNLHVFGVNPDGILFTRVRTGGSWGAWTSLDGVLSSAPSAAALGSEALVFGVNPGNALFDRHLAAGTWGSWSGLDGILTSGPKALGTGSDAYVFALNPDGNLWYRRWNGSSFGPWTNLFGILATG